MTTGPPGDAVQDPAEELAALRAEVARLRALAEPEDSGRRGWWRPVVAGLLVATAALLAPLSVLATWSSGQLQDTDRYLATVGPLAEEPAVQAAVVTRLEEIIFSHLDLEDAMSDLVGALEERGLPGAAGTTLTALAGPLATGVRSFVRDRIAALVSSDAFASAWVEANRTAHSDLVAALTGESDGAVDVVDGAVSVNLATLIGAIKQQLVDAGFGIADRIPEVDASFTIIHSDDLDRVQTVLGLVVELQTWIPVLGLLLIGAAVVIARDRRRMVLVSGLAVAGSMLLLGATLNAIRPFYLDALPDSTSPAAAGVVYDHLVSFIRTGLRGVLVVALVVALVAWLSAAAGPGAAARAGIVRGLSLARAGRARAGLRTGKAGEALARFRGPIRIGVVGVAALAYLAQDHPSGATALTFVLVTVVVLVLVSVLEAAPEPATVASPSPRA